MSRFHRATRRCADTAESAPSVGNCQMGERAKKRAVLPLSVTRRFSHVPTDAPHSSASCLARLHPASSRMANLRQHSRFAPIRRSSNCSASVGFQAEPAFLAPQLLAESRLDSIDRVPEGM